MKIHTPIFVFFVLSSTLILRSDAFPSNYLLGVAPEDEMYYKGLWSSGTIKCKDGSKTFTKAQLNDDFCDCFDGTDEPDCCDGSDEYDGKNRCKNTCWEAGKVERDRLMKEIATFQKGVAIREHEIEEAKISAAKDEAELLRLKNEEKILKGIVEQLKEHKERIEKEVEKERIQKEEEEKQKKEAEESESNKHKDEDKVDAAEQEPAKSTEDDKSGILDNPPPGQNLKEDPAEPAVEVVQNAHASLDIGEEHAVQEEEGSELADVSDPDTGLGSKGEDATKDIDSLSREDLGREIGARWTGKKPEQEYNDVDDVKSTDETSANVHDEENDGYDTETDEYPHQHYEEDGTEDHMDDVGDEANDDSSSSYKYEPDEEVDMSEAENVRKEYDEASGKLSKIRSRISRLKKKLGNDFGPEKEFYSLYGQCFESKQNKYVYKVCPFKEATQEEGYSTTRLGQWEKFEESYSVMLFANGDKCWNGPDRSLKVKLRCGLRVEVADVDEPSRCEYEAMLTTPALCLEGKLKELEGELETLNKDQPQLHDEL